MGKSASSKMQVTTYAMSMHVCIGVEFDSLLEIQVGEKTAWRGNVSTEGALLINKNDLFGGIKKEGGVSGVAYFLPGGPDQVLPEALAQRQGLTSATSPGYRGVASVFFVGEAPAGSTWVPSSAGGRWVSGGGGGTTEDWTPPGLTGRVDGFDPTGGI